MTIIGQVSDSEPISGKNVRVLSCVFRVVNTSGTGSMTTLPVVSNVTVKATLTRNGNKYVIMNDNLQNLALLSNYFKGLDEWTLGANMIQKGNGNAICPILVRLPGALNLMSSDVLMLEANVAPGTYTSASFNISSCSLDFMWLPSDAVEHAIPFVKAFTMQTNSSQMNLTCGDHIKALAIFNLDKGFTTSTPATDAQQVITQVTVSSDQKTWTDLPDRMNGRIYSMFETEAEATYRGQSYYYAADGMNLTNVQINSNMTASNVTAGNNIVCWEGFIIDATTAARAVHSKAKQKAVQIQNVSNAVGAAGMKTLNSANTVASKTVVQAAQAAGAPSLAQ